MTAFLIVMLALFGLCAVAQVYFLQSGNLPPRTPLGLALDLLCNIGLIVWASILLAGMP